MNPQTATHLVWVIAILALLGIPLLLWRWFRGSAGEIRQQNPQAYDDAKRHFALGVGAAAAGMAYVAYRHRQEERLEHAIEHALEHEHAHDLDDFHR